MSASESMGTPKPSVEISVPEHLQRVVKDFLGDIQDAGDMADVAPCDYYEALPHNVMNPIEVISFNTPPNTDEAETSLLVICNGARFIIRSKSGHRFVGLRKALKFLRKTMASRTDYSINSFGLGMLLRQAEARV